MSKDRHCHAGDEAAAVISWGDVRCHLQSTVFLSITNVQPRGALHSSIQRPLALRISWTNEGNVAQVQVQVQVRDGL
jgi:hypothetical protein